jgi:hypothetical protein
MSSIGRYLEIAGISSDEYALDGCVEDRWCLVRAPEQGWEVFFFERGSKGSHEVFTTESSACYYLYGRLVEHQVMTGRLIAVPEV